MDIGRCFNEALEVYKRNLAQLVVAAFVFDFLSLVSLTILMGPLMGGWCLMTVNAIRRKDKFVDLGDLFRGFGKFFSLFGLLYVGAIPILVGLVLGIVPGVLLMTIWIFCFFLVVDRDEGIFSSLGLSKRIVTASGLGNYLLLVIIVTAISIAPCAIPYVGFIIGWFLMPIAMLVEAAAYVQEVDEKKPPIITKPMV